MIIKKPLCYYELVFNWLCTITINVIYLSTTISRIETLTITNDKITLRIDMLQFLVAQNDTQSVIPSTTTTKNKKKSK